jgi:hypothetical protein
MIAHASMFETQQTEEAYRSEEKRIAVSNGDEAGRYVYLLGRPTLKQFLRFMRHTAVGGQSIYKGALTDEWREANDYIHKLEKDEAGAASYFPTGRLEAGLQPLRAELEKDPLIVNGFNTVPTDIRVVELDRLVVYQKHIDLDHVDRLKEKIGPAPTPEEVFRICLPADHPQPPLKWMRGHDDSFVFMSPSNDLRFLGTMPLEPKHIQGYPPPGTLGGVIGLAVGFGSNFLNAVYADNRVVLNNGSHRAYALRDLGVTHVPCIVQFVTSRDEFDVVASGNLRERPDHYLKHPRPPLLKDYFDPKLRKIVPVHRRHRQVTVKFEVDEVYVPAL